MKEILGIKFKELPKFHGAIIENGEVVGFGHFQSTGYWVGAGGKHITSYMRVEDLESEDDFCTDAQYSRLRKVDKNGKTWNLFFIESYDGADFDAYLDGLRADKSVKAWEFKNV